MIGVMLDAESGEEDYPGVNSGDVAIPSDSDPSDEEEVKRRKTRTELQRSVDWDFNSDSAESDEIATKMPWV